MKNMFKISIIVLSIMLFPVSIVYAHNNIMSYSLQEGGYNMTYKLMNITTDLSDTTYVGMILKDFKIIGTLNSDIDIFPIVGDLSWENPEYVIKSGSQLVNIIFTKNDGSTLEFEIEIVGINEPWKYTQANFASNYVVECYEGTTLGTLITPFTFYGETRDIILDGKLLYTCNDELTIGKHDATWTFIPNNTMYKPLTGNFTISVLKNNTKDIDTSLSLSANKIYFEKTGMKYDVNINNPVDGSTYLFKSNNINIATVNSKSGLITAIGNGITLVTCTITLPDGTIKSFKIDVQVDITQDDNLPVLNENYLCLEANDKFDINVLDQIKDSKYKYSSLDTSIVKTTTLTGIVTALDIGSTSVICTITAPNKIIILRQCSIDVM